MMDGLWAYLHARSVDALARDLLDIFITYYLLYRVLLVLRGTRAMQIGVGLGLVFLLYLVARWLELLTVLNIMDTLLKSALIILVVVFQNDIRRGLMRVGSGAWFGSGRAGEARVIDEVVDAATILARHRTGAIIALEQEANLDEFVGTNNKGHTLDAAVSSRLLVSLFVPEAMNELHDGAVIIRNLRIAKAGMFFPMPETKSLEQSFGSRHRAALGITEETDAVVVVVSEERGSISFCFNGNIVANLDGPRLRSALEGVFAPRAAQKPKKAGKQGAAEPRTGPGIPPTLAGVPEVVKSDERPSTGIRIITQTGASTLDRESDSDTTPQPLRLSKPEVEVAPSSTRDSDTPPPLRKSVSMAVDTAPSSKRASRRPPPPGTPMRAAGPLRTDRPSSVPPPPASENGNVVDENSDTPGESS
jgi:uncharacterized protein (TIGR00159 family)